MVPGLYTRLRGAGAGFGSFTPLSPVQNTGPVAWYDPSICRTELLITIFCIFWLLTYTSNGIFFLAIVHINWRSICEALLNVLLRLLSS